MITLFDFADYKVYLRKKIQESAEAGERGPRPRLASAIQCQPAYLTRILDGDVHLSLEQAERANRFFLHQESEAELLFLMVQKERAGSPGLVKHFKTKIALAKEARLNLRQRLKVKESLSESDQAIYFSRWQNAAVHVASLVPELQNHEVLAERLQMAPEQIRQTVDFLISLGLLELGPQGLRSGHSRLHLGKDSPLISRHHANWRLHAIRTLETKPEAGLHYSSVVSVSREDIAALKELWIRTIEKSKAVIKDSKEETLASLCLDLYEF